MSFGKHDSGKFATDESGLLVKLISIRGGGGEGPKRKRPDIVDDALYDSEDDEDFSPNFSDSGSETEKLSSTIGNRLRNRNIKSGLSPPKPPPSSSDTTTTTPTRTSPQRRSIDLKPSAVASSYPGGQQRQKQEASHVTGNHDTLDSMRIEQEIPQDTKAAPHHDGKQQLPYSMNHDKKTHPNQVRKEDTQRYILQNLESLCDHYSQDIRFAFIPPTTKSKIDLSGSFLRADEVGSLDFFDLNEKGEITLQPRPPIFPEELPSGMKEHPLRWWGIEDPAVGDGRFKAVPLAQPRPEHAAPLVGEDRGSHADKYYQGDEYSNGHDRQYNSRNFHDPYGPPPRGGPPYFDRPRGPDRRRDRR